MLQYELQYEFFRPVFDGCDRGRVLSATNSCTDYQGTTPTGDCISYKESGQCHRVSSVQESSCTIPRSTDPVCRRRHDVYLQVYSVPTQVLLEVVKPTVLVQEAILAANVVECELYAFQHTSLGQQKLVFNLNGNKLILVFHPDRYAQEGFLRVVIVDVNVSRYQSFKYFTETGWFKLSSYPGLVLTVHTWASRLKIMVDSVQTPLTSASSDP